MPTGRFTFTTPSRRLEPDAEIGSREPVTDSLLAWLSLHRAGISAPQLDSLVTRFGSLDQIIGASETELSPIIGPHRSRAIHTARTSADADKTARWLEDTHNALVTWADACYPALLREIADPPLMLFVRGDVSCLSSPQLAVVGSRNPTPAGGETAQAFASSLASAGLCITSGLAVGIDAKAHQGAMAAQGRTIAVAGTGLDRVYPARHRELAHEIAGAGALVSEFMLGTPPARENFPRRNRLISGLAVGTLVVEAAIKSGSLITARLAGEQGREVFAIPGSIHSPLSRGCHALLRQGAKLVETAQDILEELGAILPLTQKRITAQADEAVMVEADVHDLLVHLGFDPVDVDTLVERSGLTPDRISSMLLLMELQGIIAACPGGRYQRTTKKAYQ